MYAEAGFVHARDCLRAGAGDWADAVSTAMPNIPAMIAPDAKWICLMYILSIPHYGIWHDTADGQGTKLREVLAVPNAASVMVRIIFGDTTVANDSTVVA